MKEKDQFVISHGASYYIVTISGNSFAVRPKERQPFETQNLAIAKRLHLIAMSTLLRQKPSNVRQFLIHHFEGKGWLVD